jgi:hypothetical protein
MKIIRVFAAALVVAVASAACDTADPTTTSAAPSVVVPPTTENFTGTVAVGGSDVKPFNIQLTGGTVTVTLTAAGPPSTIAMVLGLGNLIGSTCTLIASTSAQASSNPQLSGPLSAGAYCVKVSDPGTQVAPVNYSVTVTHY